MEHIPQTGIQHGVPLPGEGIGGVRFRIRFDLTANPDMGNGLLQITENADAHARGGSRPETGGAVGEGGNFAELHVADIGDDLLPEPGLGAAADDPQIGDILLLPHGVQDLAQAAAGALQNSPQEMLPLVERTHAEKDAFRLRVKDGGTLALQIGQIQEPVCAGLDSGGRGVEGTQGADVEQLLHPGNGPARALHGADHVEAAAVQRRDMEDPVLRIQKGFANLSGDPCRCAETEIEIAVPGDTGADVGTGTVTAAHGDRDAGTQAQMPGGFVGERARQFAAGMDLGELLHIQPQSLEHIRIILFRPQIHQHTVGGVGHIGGVHIPGETVDQIILGLQDLYGFSVDLGPLLLQPAALAERAGGGKDVAGDPVEIVPAEAKTQRVGDGQSSGVRMDHGGRQRLSVCVHGKAAKHMAGDADGVHPLDILGRKLPQHHHGTYGTHPPVHCILFHDAAGQMAGGVGGGHVAQNIQVFVNQRRFQSAGADIKRQ